MYYVLCTMFCAVVFSCCVCKVVYPCLYCCDSDSLSCFVSVLRDVIGCTGEGGRLSQLCSLRMLGLV